MGMLGVGAMFSDMDLLLLAIVAGICWYGSYLLWRDATGVRWFVALPFLFIGCIVGFLPMIGAVLGHADFHARRDARAREIETSYVVAYDEGRYRTMYWVLDEPPRGAALGPDAPHVVDANDHPRAVELYDQTLEGVSMLPTIGDYGGTRVGYIYGTGLLIAGTPLAAASGYALLCWQPRRRAARSQTVAPPDQTP